MDIAGALVVIGWGGLGLSIALAAALWFVRRRRVLAAAIGVLFTLSAIVSAYALWYRYRPQPSEAERELAPEIRYRVIARREPVAMVAHAAIVDLGAGSVEVVTSTPADDGSVSAETVSSFAERTGVALAINAHFFEPFESNGPFDYYPHVGDPVFPIGVAAADGVDYTKKTWRGTVVYFSAEGRPSLSDPGGEVYDAVAGRYVLVRDGVAQARVGGLGLEPRTAIGFDEAGETLYLLVIDGRQPGYSLGATLPQVGAIMVELGAHTAIELDGGGSTTLVSNIDGDLEVLNSPIHTRIPGRERPVATKLGIRLHR